MSCFKKYRYLFIFLCVFILIQFYILRTAPHTESDFLRFQKHKLEFEDYIRRRKDFQEYKRYSTQFFTFIHERDMFDIYVREKELFRKYLTDNEETGTGEETTFQPLKKQEKYVDFFYPVKKFAFALYATDNNYACATRVIINQILETSVRLDFDIIVYLPPGASSTLVHYVKEFDPKRLNVEWDGEYVVKIVKEIVHPHKGLYKYTMLKLLPLNETEYERIIYLDADALAPLKDLTHLFALPDVALAAPVGYWENELCFTSLLLVYRPCEETFNKLMDIVEPKKHDTDMNVLNTYFRPKTRGGFYLFHNDFLLLPLQYGTLTHSIRSSQTKNPEYVGSPREAYERAYVIHFSEGGKPWSRGDKEKYEGDVFNVWRSHKKTIC